jgi:IS4 transposase
VPTDWTITPGQVCEFKPWKKKVQPGGFYVGDRLYCQDLLYLKKLQKDGVDFVVRLRENFIRTPQGPAQPLTAAEVQAGVVCDGLEELGAGGGGPVLRVVQIQAAGHQFLLATTRRDLPAHLIGLIYRYRWQIEVFFKWIKTMLPCRHGLAESAAGVSIQIYTVFSAALLLLLATGRRPNKGQMEALWFFQSGFISEQEFRATLSAQKIK